MTASTELTVAEQPQQLITIEPTKYVELVFEPFAKRLANAKTLAEAAEFDVTTTAGMAVAVKHRATFREIRVASEKARKERKAPILEIGKLLDSRQKEIEAEIEPFESRFDAAIKAEEKRKDDEKIAKALAESARITAIRQSIEGLRAYATSAVGRSSMQIAAMVETIEEVEISLETHQEFAGEAELAKIATIQKLGEMLSAQVAHEAEQARIAAERDALDRQRAELAEQERQAAAARAEQESKDRAERERIEAEQRAAQEAAAAAMRAEQEAHEARMRAQQEELDRQQAEIAAERQRQADEAARVEREKQAAIAAEAARVAAEEQRKREEAEAAARAEAERIQAEKDAAEAERLRRERDGFIASGPSNVEIISVIANHWGVEGAIALRWIKTRDWHPVEIAA